MSDKLTESENMALLPKGPKDDLVVSAICTRLRCDIRTRKIFDKAIALVEFEKYKKNLLRQTCKCVIGSVIPEMDYEVQQRDKKDNENRETDKKPAYVQKYSNQGHQSEAVIVNGLPFFLQVVNCKPELLESIPLADINLKPLDNLSYLNKEYSFESLEEIAEYAKRAKYENFDSLYQKSKSIWSKYVDGDNDHLTICAARLYPIVQSLVKEKGPVLTNREIWEAIQAKIEGYIHTENTYQTEDFYEISKRKVTTILKDKFGAKPCHAGAEGKERGLEFNQSALNKLGDNYSALEEIRIISDTSDTSDTPTGGEGIVIPEIEDTTEREMKHIDIRAGPKSLDILQVKASEPSEPSEMLHSIHRAYPDSDFWTCEYCNVKADRHHFVRSNCSRSKKAHKVH